MGRKASLKIANGNSGDVVCLGCSCLCDDIRCNVDDGDASYVLPDCPISTDHFTNSPAQLPDCTVDGRPATLEEALDRAKAILLAARSPLVYGLSRTTTPAQRAAIELAERIGATIDLEVSDGFRAATIAKSRVGYVSATLGEIRNRCDLAVFWCRNLEATHPRFLERYVRADATITIGTATSTKQREARHISVHSKKVGEVLSVLLMLLGEKRLDEERVIENTGHSVSTWNGLLGQMKEATYGALIVDDRLGSVRNYEMLHRLVRELNNHTRFVCSSVPDLPNAIGATQVMTWTTGYPFAISFALGYPQYGPHEFQAETMWARKEIDASLIIASDPISHVGESAAAELKHAPLIVVDWKESPTTSAADVVFFVGRPGGDEAETAYRLDGVPLPVRARLDPDKTSASRVLRQLNSIIESPTPRI